MENLNFDSGVKEFALGAGVLRFNPADPNVYARFLEASEAIGQVEQALTQQAKALGDNAGGDQVLQLLRRADRDVKALLGSVFPGNDFDALLGGVNLLAVAGNGERVITNLFHALQGVLVDGARECARSMAK